MGWFFTLSAEIGPNQIDARTFAEHFNKLPLVLSDGKQFLCQAGYGPEGGSFKNLNWWSVTCPVKDNGKDINVFEDFQEMNELAPLLYERLKSAPPFRYALVGIEVDEFRTYEELISDDLIKEKPERFHGLVITEDIWRKLGSPEYFVSFRPGYLWIPFRPLTSW